MKKCFFIGHRDTSNDIFTLLEREVERHITECGVTEFVAGRYGNFDRMAIKAVVQAKEQHKGISLTILLPYHPAERAIYIPNEADSSLYPFEKKAVPRRFAIVRANQYAVDHADYLIAYVNHPGSNSQKLLDYAKRKGLYVTNLALHEKG